MSGEPQGDQSGLIRAGVRARVTRLAEASGSGTRRWPATVVLAVLSAGALGPLLASGVGVAALAAAGIGAITAVGGNVLTDVVKAGVAKLGQDGRQPSREDLEAELERRIQQVLEAGGQHAQRLRGELARVLRDAGAVGAAIEAAVQTGDRELQAELAAGLAALGEEFTEFAFVSADLRMQLRSIREGVDQHSAELQVAVGLGYRQATDTRLLLEQVAAIERRTRPDAAPGTGAAPRWSGGNPYRGLVPFSEADAEVFYGRELVTAQLVATVSQRLGGSGPLVVTGASGAGKSSLLRAGLIPAISRGELSEAARHWPRHVLDQPTRSPLSRLATLLAGLAGLDAPTVLRTLTDQPEYAPLLVRQALDTDTRRRNLPSGVAAGCRLVLVVDQFEEIFTLSEQGEQAAAERAAFITALYAAATTPNGADDAPAALVVIAVRGDFIDRCADHPHLAAALRDGPFILGPMAQTDLRRAITGPADAAGLDLEPGLVDTILSELRSPAGGYDAGVLPLLSQTMLTIWEHREDHRLTSRGYALTGGVTHAVATSAEAAYTGLTPRRQDLARQVFRHLITVSPTGTLTRRTILHADRTDEPRADFDQVLEAFARRRLIVVDVASAQIAHDVLLQAWPRLRGWLETDLASHALYSQLLDDADDWARNAHAASYLYRGERLTSILHAQPRWHADPDRYPVLTDTQRGFLTASTRAETRSTRLRKTVLATLAAFLALAVIAATLAVRSATQADQQRALAVSRQLAAQSETLADTDSDTSALLAAAAWRINPSPEARTSLITALARPHRGTITGHPKVFSVAFSPDGHALATGGGDKTVRLWDVKTRKALGTPLTGHTAGVTSLAFSPDGHTLATASGDSEPSDGMVRLWDVTTHRQLGALTHPGPVDAVVFSPDGHTLATTSSDVQTSGGTVRLWDLKTQKPLGTPLTSHPDGIYTVAFSPDGHTLATASGDGSMRLWDVKTRRQLSILMTTAGSITSVAFSPDGHTLATGSYTFDPRKGTVRLWDLKTRKALGAPLTGHTGPISAVAFSPDGHTLATGGGSFEEVSDKTVRLWDVKTREALGTPLTGHTDPINAVAFSPDGHTLATTSGDGSVRLWDVTTRRQLGAPLTGHTDPINAVAFSPDGHTLATGSGDDTVRLWDVTSRRQLGAPLTGHTDEVTAVAFSPDGQTLATGGYSGDKTVRLWDVKTRKALGNPLNTEVDDTAEVTSVAFSPDGHTLATANGNFYTGDGSVQVWDVTTRRQLGTPLTGHTDPINAVAFSPDGQTLATGGGTLEGGGDKTVRLWDVKTRKALGAPLTGHTAEVTSVAFSPDGHLLATGSGDHTVRLWDMTTRRQLNAPLTGHTAEVISVAFSPDGHTLATASSDVETSDGSVRLWDVTTRRQLGAPLTDHTAEVTAVVFSPDGHTLATSGGDHTVRLWEAGVPEDLIAAVCAIAGRSLTREEWAQYVPTGEDFRMVCP